MSKLVRRWGTLLVLAVALAIPLAACGGEEEADTSPAEDESAAAAAPQHLFVQVDTVWGAKGMAEDLRPLKSCVQSSRFAPGEQMGWRVKVFDPATGADIETPAVTSVLGGNKEVDPELLELESVKIELGDGQVFAAEFAGHGRPEPADAFWSFWWEIPTDYPTGVLPYTITATAKDGRVGVFRSDSIAISSALLQIVPDTFPLGD